jgi:hypothetical protein
MQPWKTQKCHQEWSDYGRDDCDLSRRTAPAFAWWTTFVKTSEILTGYIPESCCKTRMLPLLLLVGQLCGLAQFCCGNIHTGRSQWPRSLRHELSSIAWTLGSWVRIPLKAWTSVLCAFILCLCCSLCKERPCDGLIPCPRGTTDSV